MFIKQQFLNIFIQIFQLCVIDESFVIRWCHHTAHCVNAAHLHTKIIALCGMMAGDIRMKIVCASSTVCVAWRIFWYFLMALIRSLLLSSSVVLVWVVERESFIVTSHRLPAKDCPGCVRRPHVSNHEADSVCWVTRKDFLYKKRSKEHTWLRTYVGTVECGRSFSK